MNREQCTTTQCRHFNGTETDGHANGHCTVEKYDTDTGIGTTTAGYRLVFDFATTKRPESRSASTCWHTPEPLWTQGVLA